MFSVVKIFSAPLLPFDIVLGLPFTRSFKMSLCTPNSVWTPEEESEDESSICEIDLFRRS